MADAIVKIQPALCSFEGDRQNKTSQNQAVVFLKNLYEFYFGVHEMMCVIQLYNWIPHKTIHAFRSTQKQVPESDLPLHR